MSTMYRAGCIESGHGEILPIVIVTNEGMFTCSVPMADANKALQFAQVSILANSFRKWNYHRECESARRRRKPD